MYFSYYSVIPGSHRKPAGEQVPRHAKVWATDARTGATFRPLALSFSLS